MKKCLRGKELAFMPPTLLLEPDEMVHVVVSTCICYAAFCVEGAPYVLPLGFAVAPDGCIRLHLHGEGRAAAMLRAAPQVCLAFSLLEERWVDSVLAEGCAVVASPNEDGSIPVTVYIDRLSGRRFPLRGISDC